MTKYLIIAISFLFVVQLWSQENWEPTTIFYVRHAETVANVTNVYTPETESVFSELGDKQKYIIGSVLQNYSFNHIIVSPTWRTQHTILPYLQSVGRHDIKAEIWPELTECCWQEDTLAPPVSSIDEIPLEMRAHIEIIDTNFFRLKNSSESREYHWETKTYLDGINQCKLVVDSLMLKYAGKGLNILVIGHAMQGRHVIKILTNQDIHLPNASLGFYLQEQKEGGFYLEEIAE